MAPLWGSRRSWGTASLKSKAIDDRVGCAILLELLKEDLPLDVTFAFTAQEEVGTRGAFGAAFSVTPEIALVLETTTAADLPEIEGARRVCAPGKGPVISYMDGGTIYDRELFETLRSLAEERNIPLADQGIYRRGQRRPGPSSAPRPGCGWRPSPPPCATCTPPPAWGVFRTLRICGS